MESLETRQLLSAANVFATFQGLVPAGGEDSISITLSTPSFTLAGGVTVVGFRVSAEPGSALDAAPVQVRDAGGGLIAPRLSVANLPGSTASLTLVDLSSGQYTLSIAGGGVAGTYMLEAMLVGDVDGDHAVTELDRAALQSIYGRSSSDPAYKIEADANGDGLISSFDLSNLARNIGDATLVTPLFMTAGLMPPAKQILPDGSLRTNVAASSVQGAASPLASLSLDLDGDGFDDGMTSPVAGGYTLPAALAEGANTLRIRATDPFGQVRTAQLKVILDSTGPAQPTLGLAVTSDTSPVGDGETTSGRVTLVGQTDANTPVKLVETGATTTSSNTGVFQFAGVQLLEGANSFTVQAFDDLDNISQFTTTITRLPSVEQADEVTRWNQMALDTIRLDASSPPWASRAFAMVHAAIFDAINAIEGASGYYVQQTAPAGSSPDAAVASAAHRILIYLYPGQATRLNDALSVSLAAVAAGASKTNGVAVGQSVGDAIIALRANDGYLDFVEHVTDSAAGHWQPTPPAYGPPTTPQWADLDPFAMTSPEQFRATGPPALNSAQWAADYDQVKTLGRIDGSTRTTDQTEAALFWLDGAGTYTPPGHWNQIAQQLAREEGYSLSEKARLFAMLNIALADAAIACWDTKFHFDFWRPITAIRAGDTDGNTATAADPAWTPLILTPPFPEYTSGHSTFSGAADRVLSHFFGENRAFSPASLAVSAVSPPPPTKPASAVSMAAFTS